MHSNYQTRAFLLFTALLFSCIELGYLQGASKAPVRAKQGMVASSEKLASQIGIDMLKKGGNAVDAAVAVGFALAVTHPTAGNLGGGGFMMIRFASGETACIESGNSSGSSWPGCLPGQGRPDRSEGEHTRVSGQRRSGNSGGSLPCAEEVWPSFAQGGDSTGNRPG